MKDGYLEFFKRFEITDDNLLDFAHSSIILIQKDKADAEWEALKNKIDQKDKSIYVRSYGRNGSGNHLYQEFYKYLFNCNVKVDPTNNNYPTKMLQDLTGLNKKGKSPNLRNYQVSHIFGNTKNPYSFCAPWNVVFIPKILDPFTGHESKGELTSKIKKLYQDIIWEKYENLIIDYNNLMLSLEAKIDNFIKEHQSQHQRFYNSIRSEFSKIEKKD
ncbi:hypothetical protein [Pasteurella bettyae]|uniref:Uncharacterized protein n=1 Tax=Pasteurella bettyae CCUG 2042 TaxID=1095749 RepID=I3D6J3_9PAST|nr:hypothetical protein [Pasteurella bettyae]EIJ67336.1 hypothetical protein HMPREF1052_0782 [Pasteurella bettyae CCUG 2042]SUB21177.1 Uncharacterised protein [Pasteurella bettyae]